MNVKELAEREYLKSGIEIDSVNHHIFMVAYELGFKQGQIRPPASFGMIHTFVLELESNKPLKDMICMQNRIDESVYEKLMAEFILEQTAMNRTYKDLPDIQNHFRNWSRKKIQDNPMIGRTHQDGGRL